MKISFVITDLSSGGAERVVSLVANYFAGKGHRVRVILVQDCRVDYEIASEVEIIYLERKHRKPFSVFERVLGIRKATRNEDVVISFLWHVNVYTIAATRFRNQRVIISDRSDPVNELKYASWLQKKARDYCYGLADKIVFQTEGARDFYQDSVRRLGVIIPNPITPNLPRWEGPERCEKTVITSGRLSEQKNLPMAIAAFAEFSKTHADYSYVIYGEGELRGELERQIEELGLSGKIRMPGFTNRVFEALSKSAIFILPSNYEGISNSMLEALAIGVPVVVTDCPAGGARKYVENGRGGILIPTGETEALAKGMAEIVDNPAYAKELSKNAQCIREALAPEVICDCWAKLVESV